MVLFIAKKYRKYQNNQNIARFWFFSDRRNKVRTIVARVCRFGSVAGFSLRVPVTDRNIESMGMVLCVVKIFKLYKVQYGYTNKGLFINKGLVWEYWLRCATVWKYYDLIHFEVSCQFSIFNHGLQKKREKLHVEKKNRKKKKIRYIN